MDQLVCHLIVATVQEKSLHLDFMCIGSALPVLQRPCTLELGGTLPGEMLVQSDIYGGYQSIHSVVHSRVVFQVLEALQ